MSTFIDNAGNEWNVEINVETIRRVRQETGFAFGTCLNDDMRLWYDMLDDYELMPTVMASILRPAWTQQGLTENTFVNNLKGNAIDSAQEALWDAFAFFCPEKIRQTLMNIKTATEKMTADQMNQAVQMMETYTKTASDTPQLSESNPDPIHTTN